MAAAYRHYTHPTRIRALAAAHLQQFTVGTVEIGGAAFSLTDGIRLFDVAISSSHEETDHTDHPLHNYPVFRCQEVKLEHDLWSTMRGKLAIQSVTARQPTCTIVRDRGTGRTNLKDMFQIGSTTLPLGDIALPTIELEDARIVVVSRESGRDRVVEDLTLTVRAMPSARLPLTIDVVWQGGRDQTTGGHSQVDLGAGLLRNVRGGLPWMSIEAVMLALNAGYDGAGAWCDLFGLSGNVRARDYRLGGPIDGPDRSATVELHDAALSIPIGHDEEDLLPAQRYLRFDRVNGEVQLTPTGIQAEFTGLFHGSECDVTFDVHGGLNRWSTLEDVDFNAVMKLTDLRVPRPDVGREDEDRFLNHWRTLRTIYKDYDPDGVVDIEFEVDKRAGLDQPIVVKHARITAKGGTSTCRYFPYKFHDVTGRIDYTPEEIRIVDLHGTRAEGEATVNAWLDAPTLAAEKRVDIVARNMRADEDLLRALPARFRTVAAAFAPTGHVDAEITLRQPQTPEGIRPDWTTATTISLREVGLTYDRFALPVEGVTGTITVDGDRLLLTNLSGEAEGGRLTADGVVSFDRSGVTDVDVTVQARAIPLEGQLRAALPATFAAKLHEFSARGRIDVDANLALDRDAPGGVRYQARVAIRDGTMTPAVMPITLTGVQGSIDLQPGHIMIPEISARYGDARISAAGDIHGEGDAASAAVTVSAYGIRLDEQIREALPKSWRNALGDWRMEGLADTRTELRTGPGLGDKESASTRVKIRNGRVSHPRLPAPLEGVTGELLSDEDGMRLERTHGRYGAAEVQIEGIWRKSGERYAGEMTLTAFGLALDERVRALLPQGVVSVWDKVNPAGHVDLHFDRLIFSAGEGADVPPVTVNGYVELRDVTLRGSTNPVRFTGTLSGIGTVCVGERGTSLDGRLELSSLKWGAHHITGLTSDWSLARTQEGDGVVVFPEIAGELYRGRLSGKLDLRVTDANVTYDLSTMLQGMQLRSFIAAERAGTGRVGEVPDVHGQVNAGLYASGKLGDVASRRGGGRVEIVDGQLYRSPILLAILNVLNLTMPLDQALDEARGEFFLLADRLQFQEIVLRGDTLALTGSGTMTLADRAVDWHLVNVSPNTWARVPVLAEFMEGASRELVELHITGPIAEPRVQARSFRALRDEFNRLFQKRKPRTVAPSSAS
jgi:hypothetical protein